MLLYNSILKINKKYYLPCWMLYMDLIETRENPENFYFYDWESLNNHPLISQINIYKYNMDKNMDNIIRLVELCIIDITNSNDIYIIENNEIIIDLGLIKCPYCHHLIDTFGYCKCVM
jgi:hypothetical protein